MILMSSDELGDSLETQFENGGAICFIGEPVLDIYINLDHWPKLGDKACLLSQETLPGGTVANMAVNASWLGLKTRMIGCLKSGEIIDQLIKDLNEHGVNTDFISLTTDAPDPVCYVFLTV